MMKKKLTIPLAALALTLSAGGGLVAAAHADTAASVVSTVQTGRMNHDGQARPVAVGTVVSVSGSTITLTDSRSSTTYTVDASGATVTKYAAVSTGAARVAPTTIAVADIAAGDTLMVRGTLSGTNITATSIEDGAFGKGGRGGMLGHGVQGTVRSVIGSTITVTGTDGKTYTVNAGSTTVTKMQTIDVASIAVGDTVGVQGTVNGTSITAKHIMDGQFPRQNGGTTTK